MGNEKDFSQRVRNALKGASCQVYPVETGGTVVGFPDLVVVLPSGATFVELKSRLSEPMMVVVDKPIEGAGQRAFARGFAKKSCYRLWGGVEVTHHSFLLVECLDGVLLSVEEVEGKGAYPVACWESMPSGVDLRDALRAWKVRCTPSKDWEGERLVGAWLNCHAVHKELTGINFEVTEKEIVAGLEGVEDTEALLKDKEQAIAVARNVCDRGRIFLLTKSIKDNPVEFVPLEGNNGSILSKGE